MPYIVVENFGGGMDVRRSSAAAPGGTMREIRNAFVNKGGEIEKREAMVQVVDASSSFFADLGSSLTIGPYPSFQRSGVNFVTAATLPAAGGNWINSGGGRFFAFSRGSLGFTTAATIPSFVGPSYCFGAALFADEIIVAYGYGSGAQYSVYNEIETYSPGALVRNSAAAITARNGLVNRSGGTGAVTLSTISLLDGAFYAAPHLFALGKSQVGNPELDTGTGFAQVDIRSRGDASGRPYALATYFSQVAIFCENGVQFWNVDPDPANLSYSRTIYGETLFHPRALTGFGDSDILYLTRNGIRSLTARDSSNFAVTTGIGTPIDALVRSTLASMANDPNPEISTATVFRKTGQAVFFIGSTIFVLSRYPSAGVTAWSVFNAPDVVADACPLNDGIIFRCTDNTIYTLGADFLLAETYDATEATVTTHYFGVEQPYTEKVWRSIDLACEGTWEIEYSIDPRNEAWVSLGSVTGDTHLTGGPQFEVSSPLIAFRFRTTSASAAKLSQFAIHYDVTEIKA